ncbi:helix-turn-helix domain-containing protein [Salmonella enterica]|uniref:Helix-turn-helix domain-containing protein n=1 Tax=Salmonella enterica TaxID=28901 RepID=A0A5U2FAA9_SALER|nr:helix-turn-helix domain-containing protein [Salmonella enterica]
MKTTLKSKICSIKSQTEISIALGTRPQAVSLWLKSQVPADRVIPLCKVLGWAVTPHEIRGDIYPNPTDGLPDQQD